MEENNNPRKAGALILENLAMFNEAAILMEQEIHTKIFEQFQDIIQKWAEDNACDSELDWIENESLWFAPTKWTLTTDEGELLPASFWFGSEDETDSYNIADLCGCGQTQMGFYFGKEGIRNRIWRDAYQALPASLKKLEEINFQFYKQAGGLWFLPITLDSDELAKAYESEDYDEVMEPLMQALETIKNALPIFDGILQQLPNNL